MSVIVNQNGYPTVGQPLTVLGAVDRTKINIDVTSVTLMAANNNRLGYEFQNVGTTLLALNFHGEDASLTPADGVGSYILYPGTYFSPAITSVDEVTVVSDTVGGMLVATEY